MALTKKQRQEVFNKSNGICWYCGTSLAEKRWHADHVEPVYRSPVIKRLKLNYLGKVRIEPQEPLIDMGASMGIPERDTIENMVPACAPCNIFKSTMSIEGLRTQISLQVERARKYNSNFRVAERYGLINIVDKPIKFWFELQT